MIRRIRQKHQFGCCVASIAMLSGLSYDRALAITHPFRKPKQHTTTTLDRALLVLTYLGLEPELKKPVSLSKVLKPALLVIDCGTRTEPYLHAVVWDPSVKKILDPFVKKAWARKRYQKNLKFIIEIENNSRA